MNKILILVFSLILLQTQAQTDIKVDKSPLLENSSSAMGAWWGYKEICNTSYGIYGLSENDGKCKLEHYGNDFKFLKTENLSLLPENSTFFHLVNLNNQLGVFTILYDKKEDVHVLYYYALNETTFVPVSEPKIIAKSSKMMSPRREFDVLVSKDQSKALVVSHILSKDEIKYELKVLDEKMNESWAKAEIFEKNKFAPHDFIIEDNGDAYMVGYQGFIDDKKEYTFQLQVYGYSDLGKQSKKYLTAISKKYVTQVKLSITKEIVACGGLSSDMGGVGGAWYCQFNKETGVIIKESKLNFSKEFLSQYLSDKEKKDLVKQTPDGYSLSVYNYYSPGKNVIRTLDDGTVVLISEIAEYMLPGSNSTTGGFRYNDIITVFISKKGEILSYFKIPKRQYSTHEGVSCVTLTSENNLYIVFNDHPDNLNIKETDAIKPLVGGGQKDKICVIVKMNKEGVFSKNELQVPAEASSDKPMIYSELTQQLSEKKLITVMHEGKEEYFVTITIE